MKVLHITDLHVDDFESGSCELLRKANYKFYLYDLIEICKEENVNSLFVTGDLINLGKEENAVHVREVLNYIIDKLNIKKSHVFIINGNHDLPRESGSFMAFDTIRDGLEEHNIVKENARYKVIKVDDKTCVIMFDSIGENFKTGQPSPLASTTIDELVELVDIEKFENILIGSHHPPESFNTQSQAMFDEGNEWSEHIWPSGGALRRKLGHESSFAKKILWFSGDTHRAEHALVDSKSVLLTTGSLNYRAPSEKVEKLDPVLPPQARIIGIADFQSSLVIQYSLFGHNQVQGEGEWKSINATVTQHDRAKVFNPPKHEHSYPEALSECNPTELFKLESKTPKVVNQQESLFKEKLLDEQLEKLISTYVDNNKLYKNGVFGVGKVKSLSWINVTSLLSNREVYRKVIDILKNELDEVLKSNSISKDDVILTGIDNWGAIIAHRLGSATNIKSCNVGVSNNSESYLPEEKFNSKLNKVFKSKKLILFISDVVATGETLKRIHEMINRKDCIFECMTVVYDPTQVRADTLNFLNNLTYLCSNIKMPLMESKYLKA